MSSRAAWLLLPALLLIAPAAQARKTSHCEAEITEYCVEESCPDFCEATVAEGEGHEAAAAACKKNCTAEAWCKGVPLKGHGAPGREELDDENREELFACIAEENDPDGSQTGRDTTTPWKKATTNTWDKKVAPKAGPKPVTRGARGCGCEVVGGDAAGASLGWLGLAGLAGLTAAVVGRARRRSVRRRG
jgi:hypothetical protein